jgi:hypothetical protein
MKKLIVLFLTAFSFAAQAQAPVKQSGSITPTHASCWTTTGVIQDCGTAAVPFLTTFGIVHDGAGAFCVNSAATTGPYNSLCLQVSTSGPAQVVLQNHGGAAAQPLQFVLNGTTAVLATVTGPFTTNDISCFQNTAGVLYDCGFTIAQITAPVIIANIKCDGVTHVSAALNSIISSNPGAIIQLPTGTCLLDATITDTGVNVSIRGAGEGATTLKMLADATCTASTVMKFDTLNNVSISDLTVDINNNFSCLYGIYVIISSSFTFDHVAVTNMVQYGVAFESSRNGSFKNGSISFNPPAVLTNGTTAAGNSTLHFASVPSWIVPGMDVYDRTTGANIAIPAGATVQSVTSTTVVLTAAVTGAGVGSGDNISFETMPNQAFVVASSISLSSNILFENNSVTGSGLFLQGDQIRVLSNAVASYRFGTGFGTNDTIAGSPACLSYIISDNVFTGGRGLDNNSTVSGGGELLGCNSIVSGNIIANNDGLGISVFSEHSTISNNVIFGNGLLTTGATQSHDGIIAAWGGNQDGLRGSNNLISGNVIYDQGGGTQQYCYSEFNNGSNIIGNIVQDNWFSCALGPIRPGYSATLSSLLWPVGVTDFTATSGFVKQATTGAPFTVGPIGTGPTSWTPTDASGASLSITNNASRYYVVGKLCYVTLDVTYPTTASGTSAALGSLPCNQTTSVGNSTISTLTGYQTSAVPLLYIQATNYSPTLLTFTSNQVGTPVTNVSLSTFTVRATIMILTD